MHLKPVCMYAYQPGIYYQYAYWRTYEILTKRLCVHILLLHNLFLRKSIFFSYHTTWVIN